MILLLSSSNAFYGNKRSAIVPQPLLPSSIMMLQKIISTDMKGMIKPTQRGDNASILNRRNLFKGCFNLNAVKLAKQEIHTQETFRL